MVLEDSDDHKDANINTYDGVSDRPAYGSHWDDEYYERLIVSREMFYA